jgi:hypothetical protein
MLGMRVLTSWVAGGGEGICSESFTLVVATSEVGRSLAAADVGVGWRGG